MTPLDAYYLEKWLFEVGACADFRLRALEQQAMDDVLFLAMRSYPMTLWQILQLIDGRAIGELEIPQGLDYTQQGMFIYGNWPAIMLFLEESVRRVDEVEDMLKEVGVEKFTLVSIKAFYINGGRFV